MTNCATISIYTTDESRKNYKHSDGAYLRQGDKDLDPWSQIATKI